MRTWSDKDLAAEECCSQYSTTVLYVADPPRNADLSGWSKPGWYFVDEADGLNGPFNDRDEAEKALNTYCTELLTILN